MFVTRLLKILTTINLLPFVLVILYHSLMGCGRLLCTLLLV